MNMEELKLIADTITSLGAQGKEAFIWWVVLETIPSFLLWSGFIGVLYYGISLIRAYACSHTFFTECRDALGYGRGVLVDSEIIQVQNKVRLLIAEHVANNKTSYR